MNNHRLKRITLTTAALAIIAPVGLAGAMTIQPPPGNDITPDMLQHPTSYQLSIAGTCPGTVTVFWGGAPSSATQVLLIGNSLGSFTIPPGPCVGTVMQIMGSVSIVTPPGFFSTGPSGVGMISGTAGAAACGRYLQAIEGSLCMTSNPVQIP